MRTKTQSVFFAITASAAASLCIAAAASPAAARGGPNPLTVAPKASGGGAAAKKICMTIEPVTGTRIARKECRTRAQWEAEGFTVTTRAKAKEVK